MPNNAKLISYDLCAPDRDYQQLYDKIDAYPKRAHICQSTWLILTDDTCADICSNLYEAMDTNDKIIVSSLSSDFEWRNILGADAIK